MTQKPKRSLEETVRKEMPEFAEEVQSLSASELNDRIANYAKDVEAVQDAVEADQGLEQAREQVNQLSAPYREAKKALRMKIRYIIGMTKEQG